MPSPPPLTLKYNLTPALTWCNLHIKTFPNMRTNLIEQKGMTFDHDFTYSFPLFSSLLKKEGREEENKVAKIVIKSHAFLLDLIPYFWLKYHKEHLS